MIPLSHTIVTLKPARQAALQAILSVDERRKNGAKLPSLPHVRIFLRVLTGSSRINSDVARRIPGLFWEPKDRLTTLKQIEEALDRLIASHGEHCPLPLSQDVQAELFPEVLHSRVGRTLHREKIKFTREMRRKDRIIESEYLQRQNLLAKAVVELNFQSPETINTWYSRWSDEFDAGELEPAFWKWSTRFASLSELEWYRYSNEPLWSVLRELPYIIKDTPINIREAERWGVPNKIALKMNRANT